MLLTAQSDADVTTKEKTMSEELELPHHLSDVQLDQIKELLLKGDKLEAVKTYRKYADCTLMEAKKGVESLAKQSGMNLPEPKGCAGVMLLIITAGFAASSLV